MSDAFNKTCVESDYINSMLGDSSIQNTSKTVINLGRNEFATNLYADVNYTVLKIKGVSFAIPSHFVETSLCQKEVFLEKTNNLRRGNIFHNGDVISIIDLTNFVIDNNIDSQVDNLVDGESVDILIIKDAKIGIIYDQFIGDQTVSLSDIKWRSSESKNKWLAGTVKKYGFSLLDPTEISNLIRT